MLKALEEIASLKADKFDHAYITMKEVTMKKKYGEKRVVELDAIGFEKKFDVPVLAIINYEEY